MGEINHFDIGFMQGRLSDIKDQKIQQFPYDNWSNEFYLAKKNNFTKIEWTIDLETLPLNPIYSKEGRNEIVYYKNKYNIKIESLTGDLFMQKPFWKNIGFNQKVLKNLFLETINCAKKVGIKYIMKAKNENTDQDFIINLKAADSEFDLAQEKPTLTLFDPNNPEGKYTLNVET